MEQLCNVYFADLNCILLNEKSIISEMYMMRLIF